MAASKRKIFNVMIAETAFAAANEEEQKKEKENEDFLCMEYARPR